MVFCRINDLLRNKYYNVFAYSEVPLCTPRKGGSVDTEVRWVDAKTWRLGLDWSVRTGQSRHLSTHLQTSLYGSSEIKKKNTKHHGIVVIMNRPDTANDDDRG